MSFHIETVLAASELPPDVEPFLRRDEARCEGVVCFLLRFRAARVQGPASLWLVRDGTRLVGVAAHEKARGLRLSPMPRAAACALAAMTPDLDLSRGVLGPRSIVEEYCEIPSERRARLAMALRLFTLRAVTPPAGVRGRFRLARAGDLERIFKFYAAFSAEALRESVDAIVLLPRLRDFIAMGNYYVWEVDGEVVSMAFRSRDTFCGTGISLVYTPPEERGHGYASACVASASAFLLAEGRAFCFLYTDETNPTSNAIYQRIGYGFVENFAHYEWDDRMG